MGRYRPLKQVQEDYQKFSQHRQRGHSQSVVSAGDVSLTNPGTEVTINCVNIRLSNPTAVQVYVVDSKWLEMWKSLATTHQANLSNLVSVLSASKSTNQGSIGSKKYASNIFTHLLAKINPLEKRANLKSSFHTSLMKGSCCLKMDI